ncbi:SigE family RNA polymerase sigma factor [Actinophytocola gossypii]|uniref:RNA polymerase sigma factor n=1 Tax=Actinophytocola gossypii TaxID=2812003 RepID=A0ABT2JGX3_9PSEU|nr:SigE family RNA polymerase sigma factor [Actinophytocola gossypii]MCT2587127.1 SigE family RNA polymerase sigma factor [Actinophytocola gossypii]
MTTGDWFAGLYQGSYRSLVLTAYALTGDLGEAEEITQEAFVVAYGRRHRVLRADSPEAWIRTVVVNLARRRWRRRAMLDRILRRGHADPDPPPEPTGEHLDLHAAIRALGREHQAAVVLHYLADLPVDEVASILDVPVGTVKSRLSRARAALAEQLRESEVDHA